MLGIANMMSGSLWVEMTLLVEMHQIWKTDAFSMGYRFIFLVIAHTGKTGLQGVMRGTWLMMIITRFRHCLWNFMMKKGNYDIDLTLSWTGSGIQISLYHGQHWFRWWLFSCSIQSRYLNRYIESRLVPLDTLGTGISVIIIYGTRTSDDYSEQFPLESIYNIFNE